MHRCGAFIHDQEVLSDLTNTVVHKSVNVKEGMPRLVRHCVLKIALVRQVPVLVNYHVAHIPDHVVDYIRGSDLRS